MDSKRQERNTVIEQLEDAFQEMVVDEAVKEKLRIVGVNSLTYEHDSREKNRQEQEKVTENKSSDNHNSVVKNSHETKGESAPAVEQEGAVSQSHGNINENTSIESSPKDTPACDDPNEEAVKLISDVTEGRDSTDSPGKLEDSSCGASSLEAEDNINVDWSESQEEEEQIEDEMTEGEREKLKQAKLLESKGKRLFKEKKYKAALEMYKDALRICPLSHAMERSYLYSNRAACKFNLEKNTCAIKDCGKALSLFPDNVEALQMRGDFNQETGNLSESVRDYKRATKAIETVAEQIKASNETMEDEEVVYCDSDLDPNQGIYCDSDLDPNQGIYSDRDLDPNQPKPTLTPNCFGGHTHFLKQITANPSSLKAFKNLEALEIEHEYEYPEEEEEKNRRAIQFLLSLAK